MGERSRGREQPPRRGALVDRSRDQQRRRLAPRRWPGRACALPRAAARSRTGQDLDFCTVASSRPGLQQLLAERGYAPDKTFNALYGNKQLYFTHTETGLALDVIVDKLQMCHTLDFGSRVANFPYTLEPLDVLLSKLQIVELNAKDADDCLRLLVTYPLADKPEPGAMNSRVLPRPGGRRLGLVADGHAEPREDPRATRRPERQTLVAAGALDPDVQLAALTRAAHDAPKTGAGSSGRRSANGSAGTSSPRRRRTNYGWSRARSRTARTPAHTARPRSDRAAGRCRWPRSRRR